MTEAFERLADIEIVPAQIGDVDQIIAVLRAAYRIEAELYGGVLLPPQTETRDQLGAALDTHAVLVARRRDPVPAAAVVGSARASISGDTAHISRLSVLPALHGRGPGHRTSSARGHRGGDRTGAALRAVHRAPQRAQPADVRACGLRGARTERQSDAVVLVYLEKVVTTGLPDDPPSHGGT